MLNVVGVILLFLVKFLMEVAYKVSRHGVNGSSSGYMVSKVVGYIVSHYLFYDISVGKATYKSSKL